MAIVFVSPKQRQKMFFLGITILFLLFLSVVGTVVFFSKPSKPKPTEEQIFIKPDVKINFEILDLDQVKESLLMGKVQKEFAYSATTAQRKKESGNIFANSIDEAKKKLEDSGLFLSNLEEIFVVGRENPFASYYTPSFPTK